MISALYSAFSEGVDLTTEALVAEAKATRPLSVTMGEKITELRAWAMDRAVKAD